MRIKNIPIKNLKQYDKNPRVIPEDAILKVSKSIEVHGFNQPIVTDEKLRICVGHVRYLAAKKLGLKDVPVFVKKFNSEAEFIAYNVADNKTSEFSIWDNDGLKDILQLIEDDDSDLISSLGFSEDEISTLLNTDTTDERDDAVPKVSEFTLSLKFKTKKDFQDFLVFLDTLKNKKFKINEQAIS